MPDPTTDLLLTIGADTTALRQQIALLSQELGVAIQPIKLRVEATGVKEVEQGLTGAQVAASKVTAELNDVQKALDRNAAATVRWQAEFAAGTQRAGRIQSAAIAENETLTRKLGVTQIQSGLEYEALLRKLGVTQIRAATEYEAAVRKLGVAQVQGYAENARLEQQQQLQRIRNIEALKVQLAQLQKLQASINLPAGFTSQITTLQGAQATLQAGGIIDPVVLARLKTQTSEFRREIETLNPKIAQADSFLSTFFGRFGRYIQIAGQLTLVYGAFRAVTSEITEFIAVDKILHQIAATMDQSANRAEVLRQSWALMVQANQAFGTSFSEAGKVVFELQKALNNSAEQIQGAFIPALALASLGEGNQTEIIRALIGLYKIFGDTLGNTTPQEKYLAISDKLIAAAASSIQDIDGFRTALQNVAPVAAVANISLNETLAGLILLTNGLQSASRAGTGFRALIVDLQTRGPQIAQALKIPFDIDAPLDAMKLLDRVIAKLKETGATSLQTQLAINAAFPDKRAALALEAFVKTWGDYGNALNDVTNSAGKTGVVVKELSETVSAAFGRLSGALFKGFADSLDVLFNVKPGDTAGLVQAIDAVTGAIKLLSGDAVTAITILKQLLELVPRIPKLPGEGPGRTGAETIRRFVGQVIPGLGLAQGLADIKAANDAQVIANQLASEQQYLLAAGVGDSLKSNAILAQRTELTAELNKRLAELHSIAQANLAVSDQTLSFDARLAAAEFLITKRRQERIQAENDFRQLDLPKAEQGSIDTAGAKVIATLEAENRAIKQRLELKKQVNDADIAFSQQQAKSAEDARKALEAFDNLLASQQGKLKDLTASEKFAADDMAKLLSTLNDLQFKAISPEEFAARNAAVTAFGIALQRNLIEPLLQITRSDQENALENLFAAMLKAGREADNLRSKLGPGATSGITGGVLPTGIAVQTRLTERDLGLDKMRDALNQLGAQSSNIFEQMILDTAAAGKGFTSFAALVEASAHAAAIAESMLEDAATPVTEAEQKATKAALDRADALAILVTVIQKLVPETKALQNAEITDATRQTTNALRDAVAAFGQVGAETQKYTLARVSLKRSYDDLLPAEKAEIDALARLQERLQILSALDAGTKTAIDDLKLLTANFGLSDEAAARNTLAIKLTHKTYTELAEAAQDSSDELVEFIATQAKLTVEAKRVNDVLALQAIGFSKLAAEAIVAQNSINAIKFKALDDAIVQLEAANTSTQKFAEKWSELQVQLAQQTGNPFAFFLASMDAAGVKAGDFWENLRTLAEDTAKQMSSSLSDFFFAKFTGQLTTAKELFKAFTDSILRSISNFLAQAVVSQFLSLLGSVGSAVFGTGGSAAASAASAVGGTGLGGISSSALAALGLSVGGSALIAGNALGIPGLSSAGGVGSLVGGLSAVVQAVTANTSAITAATAGTANFTTVMGLQINAQAAQTAGLSGLGSLQGIGGLAGIAGGLLGLFGGGGLQVQSASSLLGLLGTGIGLAGAVGAGGLGAAAAGAGAGLAGAGAAAAAFAPYIAAVVAAVFGIMNSFQTSTAAGWAALTPAQQTGTVIGASIGNPLLAPFALSGIIPARYASFIDPIGGWIGGLLGGLFGGAPRLTHAQREALEANRAISAANVFNQNIAASMTPTQLFSTLVAQQSQSVGGTASTAISVGIRRPMTIDELRALVAAGDILLPTGKTVEEVIATWSNMFAPGASTTFGVGLQNAAQPVWTQQGFFRQAALDPTSVFSGIQAGVTPGLITPANQAVVTTILNQITNIKTLSTAINQAIADIFAGTGPTPPIKLTDHLRTQAKDFRTVLDQLIQDNADEQARITGLLETETNPGKVLEYTVQIRDLIQARYDDEIKLVKQFAGALDELAANFVKVAKAVDDQIAALQEQYFPLDPSSPEAATKRQATLFDAQKIFSSAVKDFFGGATKPSITSLGFGSVVPPTSEIMTPGVGIAATRFGPITPGFTVGPGGTPTPENAQAIQAAAAAYLAAADDIRQAAYNTADALDQLAEDLRAVSESIADQIAELQQAYFPPSAEEALASTQDDFNQARQAFFGGPGEGMQAQTIENAQAIQASASAYLAAADAIRQAAYKAADALDQAAEEFQAASASIAEQISALQQTYFPPSDTQALASAQAAFDVAKGAFFGGPGEGMQVQTPQSAQAIQAAASSYLAAASAADKKRWADEQALKKAMGQDEETLINNRYDAERERINAKYDLERERIQKILSSIQELKQVSEALEKQILGLKLSNFGSTNPSDQFQLAQQTYEDALAAFNADPTAKNAQAVQAAVDAMLQKAADLYTRPSTAFRAIFDQTIKDLEAVKARVDKEADLASLLADGNALAALTAKHTADLKALAEQQRIELAAALANATYKPSPEFTKIFDDTIATLTAVQAIIDEQAAAAAAAAAATRAAADAAFLAVFTSTIATLTAVQVIIDDQARANAATAAATRAAADAAFQAIFNTTIAALEAVGVSLHAQAAEITDVLGEILGIGNTIADLTAHNTTAMADDMAELLALVRARFIALGFEPPPPETPSAQHGAWYTAGGLYRLHEGEMVLPPAVAASIRQSGGGGGGITLMISPGAIVVTGTSDPIEVGKSVVKEVESSIRTGRLGHVIAQRVGK